MNINTYIKQCQKDLVLPDLDRLASGNAIDELSASSWEYLCSIAVPAGHIKLWAKHPLAQKNYATRYRKTIMYNKMLGMIIQGRDVRKAFDEDREEECNMDTKNNSNIPDVPLSDDGCMDLEEFMMDFVDKARTFAYEFLNEVQLDIGNALFEISQFGFFPGKTFKVTREYPEQQVLLRQINGMFRPTNTIDLFQGRAMMLNNGELKDIVSQWQCVKDEDEEEEEEGATILDEDEATTLPQRRQRQMVRQTCEEYYENYSDAARLEASQTEIWNKAPSPDKEWRRSLFDVVERVGPSRPPHPNGGSIDDLVAALNEWHLNPDKSDK